MPSIHQNKLVERWNAEPSLTTLVDEARNRLHDDLYESGSAARVLARWVGVLEEQAADMIDAGTIATESEAIAEYFTQEP